MSDLDLLNLNASSRNEMQKVAMYAIYDTLTYIDMGQPLDVKEIVSSLLEVEYEEADYFVKAAVIQTIKNYSVIVGQFNIFMRKWTFDRLNRVEQAILLLAYVHFFYVESDVDKRIVIDIAVKQSKEFLDDNDYKFVNAILENVLRK